MPNVNGAWPNPTSRPIAHTYELPGGCDDASIRLELPWFETADLHSLSDLVLSVVTPAFNEEASITAAIDAIRHHLDCLDVTYEIIVVSDGSTDSTRARVEAIGDSRVQVIEYERNMGKGYALRSGSRTARGQWIAWFDADLDLDPSAIGRYLDVARRDGLDVVIGSKRHADSVVHYPKRRRIYSWLYQRLVHLLFNLRVRDTQVGVKLFRREALDEVLPVVLVKRYAFDLEVLVVARRFGYSAIREESIELTYQFSGSGINFRAIVNALCDTAAIFYRLRVLHFYDRRRRLSRRIRAFDDQHTPTLAVAIVPTVGQPSDFYDQSVDEMRSGVDTSWIAAARIGGSQITSDAAWFSEVLNANDAEAIGVLEAGMVVMPSWERAALELLRDPSVAAVVGPTVPLLTGDVRLDAAALVSESLFGVGGARSRHQVGALREVDAFSGSNMVVRRNDLQHAIDAGLGSASDFWQNLRWREGATILCSPDLVAQSVGTIPLFGPYLRTLWVHGILRGRQVGRRRQVRVRHILPVFLVMLIALAPIAFIAGGLLGRVTLILLIAYLGCVATFFSVVVFTQRRTKLAALTAVGAVVSHLTFGLALIVGVVRRISTRPSGASAPRP